MRRFFTRENRYLLLALGMSAFAACGFFAPTTAAAQTQVSLAYDTSNDGWWTGLIRVVAIFGFLLAKWLLMISGIAFNLATFHGVFDFKNLAGVNSEGMLAAWSMLRDIANIGLIFGFVMIGMATILDIHGYDVKKTLPRLIIFAVLLNFSLLASQAVIDAANITSAAVYTSASGSCDSAGSIRDCATDANYGPSGFVIQMSGISGDWLSTPNQYNYSDVATSILAAGLSIFMAITAMVLFAGAIMLIFRAAILVFLMITSPIGFAGMALPPLEPYAQKWWKMLLSQSFFAPVLLILIMVSLKVMETVRNVLGGADGAENSLAAVLADANPDQASALIVFAMSIAFMILALVAAKRMGAYGADFAISMSRKAVSAPFAFPTRSAVGFTGRKTQEAYERSGLAKTLRKIPLLGTGIDDAVMATTQKAQNLDIGLKQAYAQKRDTDKKRDEHLKHEEHLAHAKSELAAALKSGDQNRIATAVGKLKDAELAETLEKAAGNQAELISNSMSADRAKKFLDNDKISDTAKEKLRTARFGFLEPGLASYSNMIDEYDASLAQINNDTTLSPEQKASRRRDLDAAFADRRTSMKAFEKRVRDMAVKDYATMSEANANVVRRIIEASNLDMQSLMSNDQLEAIEKDSGFQAPIRGSAKENTRRGRVKRWLTEYRTETARGDDANVARVLTLGGNIQRVANKMSGKEKAKMDKDDILHPTVLKTVGANDFQTIIAEGSFAEPEIEALVEGAVRAADNEKLEAFNNLAAKSQLTDGVTGLSRKVAAEAARRGIAL